MNTKGLKKIGQGLFSTVYRLNETQVLIKSTDYVKECLSMQWHDSEGIFPEIERVDNEFYTCKYYEPVKSLKNSLNDEHYAVYRELRDLSIGFIKNSHDNYFKWREQFQTVSNEEFRYALINMIDNLTNYGTEISFEISPRNVAVENGRLILLDVFFFKDQANKIRTSKSKRQRYQY